MRAEVRRANDRVSKLAWMVTVPWIQGTEGSRVFSRGTRAELIAFLEPIERINALRLGLNWRRRSDAEAIRKADLILSWRNERMSRYLTPPWRAGREGATER